MKENITCVSLKQKLSVFIGTSTISEKEQFQGLWPIRLRIPFKWQIKSRFLGFLLLLFLTLINLIPTQAQENYIITGYPGYGTGYYAIPGMVNNLETRYNGLQQNVPIIQYQKTKALLLPPDARLLASYVDINHPGIIVMGPTSSPQIFVDFANNLGNFSDKFISRAVLSPDLPPLSTSYDYIDAQSVLWGLQKLSEYTFNQFSWKGVDQFGLQSYIAFVEDLPHNRSSFFTPTGPGAGIHIKAPKSGSGIISETSLDIIGHEAGHAILYFSKNISESVDDIDGDDNSLNYENKSIREAFGDILGVSLRRSVGRSQGKPVTWILGDLVKPGGFRDFENPHNLGHADTYKEGFFWKEEDPNNVMVSIASYHDNASVIDHWLYLLVNGTPAGVPKINGIGNSYTVQKLSGINNIGEELAAKLVFNTIIKNPAFTEQTDFMAFRALTLETAISMGWPAGSQPYRSIMDAWYAVGVGPKFLPDGYDPQPNPPSSVNAETWYDGLQPVSTTKVLMEQNTPLGFSMSKLLAYPSGNLPEISTRISSSEPYVDMDKDMNFDLDNDPESSKNGVSVHWATEHTLKYFSETHNWHGLDDNASAGMPVNSLVGDYVQKGYDDVDKTFYYYGVKDPLTPPDLSLDMVASEITKAISFLKAGAIDPNNTEALAIRESLGQIFGVLIKNRTMNDPFEWQWTLGQNVSGPPVKQDFKNPKAYDNPSFYQGAAYNANLAYPERLAGMMDHWFYLLCKGGAGYRDDDPTKADYLLSGIGADYGEQILFELLMNIDRNGDFAAARALSLKIAEGLASGNPLLEEELVNNVKEAWYAVGIGESGEAILAAYPVDKAENVDMWPTRMGFQCSNKLINWEYQISTDPEFLEPDETKIIPQTAASISPAPGKLGVWSDANLDGGVTYYWRARPTTILNEEGKELSFDELFPPSGEVPEVNIGGGLAPDILWSKTREFTTNPSEPKILSPVNDSMYPWIGENGKGGRFIWNGVEGKVESYQVQVAEDDQFIKMDTYLDQPIKAKGAGQQECQFNLKVAKNYYWKVQPIGPEHTIYAGTNLKRAAKGTSTKARMFHTTTPMAECNEPANGSLEAPWNIPVSVKPLDGATDYRYELGLNHDNFSVNDLHVVGVKDESFLIRTELGLLPGSIGDGQTIYWRVKPKGPNLPLDKTGQPGPEFGKSKDFKSFKVDYSLVKVQLEKPSSGHQIYQTYGDDIAFRWTQPKAGSGGYKINIYKNGAAAPFKSSDNNPLPGTAFAISNKDFYDGSNSNYTWEVFTLPPVGPGSANLPQVKSHQYYFYMDADIPTLKEPGFECTSGKGCDLLYSDLNNSIPVIAYDKAANIFFRWDGQYAPRDYNFRLIEWGASGLVKDEIVAASLSLKHSHGIPMKDLKPNTTYAWSPRPILISNANALAFTTGGLPINTDQPNIMLFKTGEDPEELEEWSGPIEIVFEEGSAKDYGLYVITPDNDEIWQGIGYDHSKYEYWYDGPDDPIEPVGNAPDGVDISNSKRTVDVIRIFNPQPGVYTIGIELYGGLDNCPYPFKISVRQNGKEKAVVEGTSITCDDLNNYDEKEFTYTH
ncbi:MAG: M4 family metallopeptidase [Daejeonella sp.]